MKIRRKMLFAALGCVLFACAGCSDREADEKGEKVRAGVLEISDVEARLAAITPKNQFRRDFAEKVQSVPFDSLQNMLAALRAGRIAFAGVPRIVADYTARKTSGVTVVPDQLTFKLRMALRGEDTALCGGINTALAGMKLDGSLAGLTRKYLDPDAPAAPSGAKNPRLRTLRIGVTGDLPPLDFIGDDGVPRGFNAGLASALAEKVGVNVELVPVAAQARFAALQSGRIDVIFWIYVTGDLARTGGGNTLAGDRRVITTVDYYSGDSAFLSTGFPPKKIRELISGE